MRRGLLHGQLFPVRPLLTIPRHEQVSQSPHGLGELWYEVTDSIVTASGDFDHELTLDNFMNQLTRFVEYHIDFHCLVNNENRRFLVQFIEDSDDAPATEFVATYDFEGAEENVNNWGNRELEMLADPIFQPYFDRYLRSMREAKAGFAGDAPMHCHRANEALRKYYETTEELDRPGAWERLRGIADFTEGDYRQAIDRFAKESRHGGHLTPAGDYLSADERNQAIRLSIQIGLAVMRVRLGKPAVDLS